MRKLHIPEDYREDWRQDALNTLSKNLLPLKLLFLLTIPQVIFPAAPDTYLHPKAGEESARRSPSTEENCIFGGFAPERPREEDSPSSPVIHDSNPTRAP